MVVKQSELTVITKAKELCSYVLTISDKSPKKFRFTLSSRLQNYSISIVEQLLYANEVRMAVKNTQLLGKRLEMRRNFQQQAFTDMKMLAYLSQLAMEQQCILPRQYEQITKRLYDCQNLRLPQVYDIRPERKRDTGVIFRDHYKKYGAEGYILKFDIRKYFPSIDHEVLKEKLARFPDEEVKTLLYFIIDSYAADIGKGLPMGNQSSQWFALYYLDRLDRLIKEKLRIKGYVRYMDDGVLIHESKEYLQECLRQMQDLISEEKLEFNQKTQIFPISQGVDFLGWRFYMTDTGKIICRLRTSNKKRFKRRLKAFQKQYADGTKTLDEITQSLNSYRGHLKYGHTWKLRKHVYKNFVLSRHKEERREEEEFETKKFKEKGRRASAGGDNDGQSVSGLSYGSPCGGIARQHTVCHSGRIKGV